MRNIKEQSVEYAVNNHKLRLNRAIAKCAEIIIKKQTKILDNNDYEEIGKAYDNAPEVSKVAIQRIKRLMSSEIVKNRVNTVLDTLLTKHNLKEDTAFEVLKDAIRAAKEKNNAAVLLQISEFLLQLNDLMPTKKTITATQETNYTALASNASNAIAEKKETLQIKQEN